MSVDEVVKALKLCIGSSCRGCAYGAFFNCTDLLHSDIAHLLEQLQAENKQVTKDRDEWKCVAEASRDVIQPKLKAAIYKLKESQLECCKLCSKDMPFDFCCLKECNQHEFCRDCSYGERSVEE